MREQDTQGWVSWLVSGVAPTAVAQKIRTQARLQGRNVVNITQRRISNRLLTESIEYNRSNIAVLPVQSVLPVLVQYYRYGTTGTVLHLPVPGYWYDYPVQFTVQNYRYQYYCPIYRYSFISTAVSNHSYD